MKTNFKAKRNLIKTSFLFILFLIISATPVSAQNDSISSSLEEMEDNTKTENDYQKSIEALKKGFQNKDYSVFKDFLTEDFKAGQYDKTFAAQVIPQILAQYPKLISIDVESFADYKATVNYNFENEGESTSSILFSENGKIKQIELFDQILSNAVTQVGSQNEAASTEEVTAEMLANEVEFTTQDGIKISAHFQLPKIKQETYPAIILIHQGGSSRKEWFEGTSIVDKLLKNGYAILAYDVRLHGKSGKDGEFGDLFNNPQRAPLDLKAAIQFLSKNNKIDTHKIGVLGASIGSNLACAATSSPEFNVKSAVSMSAKTDAAQNLSGLKTTIVPKNVFHIASEDEQGGIREKWAKELYEMTKGERKIEITKGNRHGSFIMQEHKYLEDDIVEWFNKTLDVTQAQNSSNKNGPIAEIPFELISDIILLKVKINDNTEENTFVFDTGATSDLLDTKTANKLGLKANYQQPVSGAGGTKSYDIVLSQKLTLQNNIVIDETHLVLTDLTALKDATERDFDGIIGYSLLNKYITKIDYDNNKILLYDKIENVTTEGYTAISFQFDNGIPIPQFDISITLNNGETFTDKILFDSGASLSLLINTPYNEKNKISQKAGKSIVSENENLNGKSVSEEVAIKSMSFGGYDLNEMTIAIAHDKDGVSAYENYLGILGAKVISRFNVILDYSSSTLYLKPNKHFATPFEFPLSGIRLRKKNGSILFDRVIKTSPAYQKGIRKGDTLISVYDNASGDIEVYRELLKKESKNISIKFINSEGKTKKVKIKLKRLL